MSVELVVRRTEIGDLAISGGVIRAIAPGLDVHGVDELDARGGAVLPGLHDHHVHLLALAAYQASVRCGPPTVRSHDDLARAIRGAAGDGWVRGVGYHESVTGDLDRHRLDAISPDRPVRVQHRSGAMWFLNTAALIETGLDSIAPDGRLRRQDHLLRDRTVFPDLAAIGALLARHGVTGLTDATPDLSRDAADHLSGSPLPQRLLLLGASSGLGPWKLVLDEETGLDLHAVATRVRSLHDEGRPVAIHCVTRAEAVVAVEAIAMAGAIRGDRIEHGSILSGDLVARIGELGITVVTQPAFVAERGDEYVRDLAREDQDDLYRCRSLLDAGVPFALSTDCPFTSADPWQTIRAAVHRRTATGTVIGADERLRPRDALERMLAPLLDPGGEPRKVEIGAPADLCVCSVPTSVVLRNLDGSDVSATVIGGRIVWRAP